MSEAAEKATVTAIDNGPYHITGPVSFVDADGKTVTTEQDLWLCRCGNSANKPNCDGSHRGAFQSVVRAP